MTRTGFEDGLFAAWRNDPEFVANKPRVPASRSSSPAPRLRHRLVARARRLGTDGLRLQGRALEPLRDIFRGNSGKAGLLSVPVEQDVIEQLWAAIEADPTTQITVDLEARTVTCGDLVAPFQIDDYTRYRLLNGLDDIGITLGNEADIAAYEAGRPSFKPVTQHA